MAILNIKLTIFVLIIFGIGNINSTKDGKKVEQTTKRLDEILNPLANLLLNENEIGDVNHNGGDHTKNSLSRAKRQYYDDPYYYRRRPVPLPIIIFGGGGLFGGPRFGGPGFGGRGFGGRGFGGGRGFSGGRGGFGGGRGGGFGGGRGGRG